MAFTLKFNSLLLAASALVLVICLSSTQAAPFFTDNAPSINLPEVNLPEMRYESVFVYPIADSIFGNKIDLLDFID